FAEQSVFHRYLTPIGLLGGFLKDVADALERRCEWGKVLGVADRLERRHALDRILEIIRTGSKRGVDLIVGEATPLPQYIPGALKQKFQHLLLHGLARFDPRRVILERFRRRRDGRRHRKRKPSLEDDLD